MLRKTTCAAAGLAIACAAAYSLSLLAQQPSRDASFDLRWLYTPAKTDRLPLQGGLRADGDVVVSFGIPARATTIVTRRPARVESAVQTPRNTVRTVPIQPVREVPNEEPKRRALPVGCEPAFSPVTTPAYAHISARCDS
ncbi:MAG: hypothetical protein AB7V13_15120 [Pseudorhodoplanes sp.]|uniref:hypothetical protein n=1 Tax=Pseudorhodoplanes sp. TaxID=1934341 RepID=UPI003D0DE316